MAGSADPLAALRDLHWPAPADASFTASLVAAFLGGAALALGVRWAVGFAASRRRPVRKAALAELERSRSLPPAERVVTQAALLRRVARTVEETDAPDRGPAWLARLDRLFATDLFSAGSGRAFGDALYGLPDRSAAPPDEAELARLIGRLRA